MSQHQSPKMVVYAGFAGGLGGVADRRVEFGDAVIEDRGILGPGVTVALLRDHVQELRPLERLHVGECLCQHVDVVPVDRTDIVEAEFLEQRARQHHALHVLFPALGELLHRRELRQHFLAAPAHRVVETRREQPREIAVQRAHRLRDRHLVVVEDDEQVGAGDAGVVQRLEGHAGAHRAVADHGDHAAVFVIALRRDRHAERRRNRSGRMRGAERVVFALRTTRKARRPARHPQPAHILAAAGQDLVRVGLVTDVPHDTIARRVEHVVERDRELDGAEIRRKVTAGLRDRSKHERAQLAGELRERLDRKTAQRRRRVDRIEQRSTSVFPQHDPVGELGEAASGAAEGRQRRSRFRAQVFRAFACGGKTEE